MREIKFRCWTGEEMVELENSGLQYFDFEGNYSLGFTVDAYSGFWAHEQYESSSKSASKFPVMQFTGRHDKNSKEIYEGDIIERDEPFAPLLIGWSKEKAAFVGSKSNDFSIEKTYNFIDDIDFSDGWTVIGNIYENPEMLQTVLP